MASNRQKRSARVPQGVDPEMNGHSEKPGSTRLVNEFSAWVDQHINRAAQLKCGLATYSATHLIEYGNSVLIGAGTTLTRLMRAIIDRLTPSARRQVEPLDLLIVTNNIGVFDEGRMAQQRDQGLLGNTSVVLTGGSYHASMYSLMGEYAASAVRSDRFYPDLVFFGARGLCFSDSDLTITYQFQEELSTQASFATRPTAHRVLLIDHTKLGAKSGWRSEAITVKSMLDHSPLFTIISTYPIHLPENHPERLAVDAQFEACSRLFATLSSRCEFAGKEFVLRMVDERGTVVKEQMLSQHRKGRTSDLGRQGPPDERA